MSDPTASAINKATNGHAETFYEGEQNFQASEAPVSKDAPIIKKPVIEKPDGSD